jgi:hypothetical protein
MADSRVTGRGAASTVFPVVSARGVRQRRADKIGDFSPEEGGATIERWRTTGGPQRLEGPTRQ